MLLFLIACAAFPNPQEVSRPNIVFIMADDMGYGDPHCFNEQSKCPTPNIDRLARAGMRFTDAHAPAALCVPTRYGLLTGRYPFRMPRGSGPLIEPSQLTLASLLKDAGYRTACVGKWHLGFENEKNPRRDVPLKGGPLDHGFDYFFGIPASLDIPPYYFIEQDRCVAEPTESIGDSHTEGVSPIQGAFWRQGRIAPGFRHRDVLATLAGKAEGMIDRLAQPEGGAPFFVYFALTAPHTPWLPEEAFAGKSQAGSFGDFVAQVDDVVGRVMAKLDQLDVSDNTILFFTSDNGPVWYASDVERYSHRSAGPLRGMKGDAWEGGHRMPFVVRWPGRVPSGSTAAQTICHTDMLATFASIVGRELPPSAIADSFDVLPAILGQQTEEPIRSATIHTVSGGNLLAIRQGRWKLIPQLGSGGFSQPRRRDPEPGEPPGQLYDLQQDIGETKNLYADHPEIVKRLTDSLEQIKRQEKREK